MSSYAEFHVNGHEIHPALNRDALRCVQCGLEVDGIRLHRDIDDAFGSACNAIKKKSGAPEALSTRGGDPSYD